METSKTNNGSEIWDNYERIKNRFSKKLSKKLSKESEGLKQQKGQRISWEKYALMLAEVASVRSEDRYCKVGSCALRHDFSVAAVGYNGPPRGIDIDWSNREERLKRIVHSEINTLSYCKPGECQLIACTMMPCGSCLSVIAAYGIKSIVYRDVYERDDSSVELAKEFGISMRQIEMG